MQIFASSTPDKLLTSSTPEESSLGMPQISHPPIIIFHHFPGVQWPLALQFLAQQQGACNVVICTACVTACARGSAWEAACRVLWEMRRGRVEPNEFTASAVISAYQKGQKWQEALEILECRWEEYGGWEYFFGGNDDEHVFPQQQNALGSSAIVKVSEQTGAAPKPIPPRFPGSK